MTEVALDVPEPCPRAAQRMLVTVLQQPRLVLGLRCWTTSVTERTYGHHVSSRQLTRCDGTCGTCGDVPLTCALMSPRRRYYHPPTAAVLAVLGQEDNRVWSIGEVVEATSLVYGSAYSILQRLWSQGEVGRQFVDGGFGHAKLYYDLSDRGWRAREQVMRFMPDPVGALRGLVVHEDGDTSASDHARTTKQSAVSRRRVRAQDKRQVHRGSHHSADSGQAEHHHARRAG